MRGPRADDAQIVRVLVDLGYFYCERSREARSMADHANLRDFASRGLAINREALERLDASRPSKLQWIAAANLGECLMDLGRLDEARATLEAMLRSVRAAPVPSAYCEGEALLSLGQISLAADRPVEAVGELGQALAIARRDGMNELVMRSCELLTIAYERTGDFKSALDHHRHFFRVHVDILSEAARLRAAALGYQLETAEARAAVSAERERSRALTQDNLALQRESLEDALTGLPNHRAFQRAFERLVDGVDDGEFFLALIDVDHFKAVNDRYSHLTGNEVLKALARVLRDASRADDFAARYGGEEFVLLLPARSRDQASRVAERNAAGDRSARLAYDGCRTFGHGQHRAGRKPRMRHVADRRGGRPPPLSRQGRGPQPRRRGRRLRSRTAWPTRSTHRPDARGAPVPVPGSCVDDDDPRRPSPATARSRDGGTGRIHRRPRLPALGGFFVFFMSRNSTRMAVALTRDAHGALVAAVLLCLFVGGVMPGTVVRRRARGRPIACVQGSITVALAAATLCHAYGADRTAIALMVLSMGAENAAFERDGEVGIGVTYVTGALVKTGQQIVTALSGGSRTAWMWHGSMWLGLVAGATAGAWAFDRWALGSLWIAVAAGAASAGIAAWIERPTPVVFGTRTQ